MSPCKIILLHFFFYIYNIDITLFMQNHVRINTECSYSIHLNKMHNKKCHLCVTRVADA